MSGIREQPLHMTDARETISADDYYPQYNCPSFLFEHTVGYTEVYLRMYAYMVFVMVFVMVMVFVYMPIVNLLLCICMYIHAYMYICIHYIDDTSCTIH